MLRPIIRPRTCRDIIVIRVGPKPGFDWVKIAHNIGVKGMMISKSMIIFIWYFVFMG
jgi:hypothetical protein